MKERLALRLALPRMREINLQAGAARLRKSGGVSTRNCAAPAARTWSEVQNVFIDRIVKWLLPRENRFLIYLDNISQSVSEASDVFAEFRTAKTIDDFKRIADSLRRKEHDT